MNDHISVICSKNPKIRLPLLLNILKEYGINQHKKIYLQSFNINETYYVNHLVSLISQIDFRIVESYMFPLEAKSNQLKKQKIDSFKFIWALEELRNSMITIRSNKVLEEETWLNYVFALSNKPYQVIIIDDFNQFVEISKESIHNIISRVNKYSQKHNAEIILFMNDKDISKYQFPNWKVSQVNTPFVFQFDRYNHDILGIDEEKNTIIIND